MASVSQVSGCSFLVGRHLLLTVTNLCRVVGIARYANRQIAVIHGHIARFHAPCSTEPGSAPRSASRNKLAATRVFVMCGQPTASSDVCR
eukprot:1085689-Rhodomonas_salina.1